MKSIFTTLYGSHLFGCNIPTSDEDYKSIHLEDLSDLLFLDTHALNTKDETGPTKIETETFSLRFYLKMLAGGQVIATDMFFAPPQFWRGEVSPLWKEIQALKPYAITRRLHAFASYAKNQAFKYGNKGLKILTVQKAIKLLESNTGFEKLCEELKGMEGIKYTTEHAAGGDIRHIEICGKDWGETTAYHLWLPVLKDLEAQYGERARLSTRGVDLKAQYQTVRITSEAIELLSTGHLTFPRPEAPLLLSIRNNELGEEALRDLVENKLAELKETVPIDSLPEKADWEKLNDFILSAEKDFLKKAL